MAKNTHFDRRNGAVLKWLRALGFGLLVLVGLRYMPFYPTAVLPLLALGCGVLALFLPQIAVIVVVLVLALPLMAANLAIGMVFLIVGLAASQYLGQDNARVFLVVALAFVASLTNAGWALAIIAGYVLGASEGAVAALLACLAVQAFGLTLGKESVGVLATGGGGTALLTFEEATAGTVVAGGQSFSALGFGWIAESFSAIEPSVLIDTATNIKDLALFVVQPFIWAIGAGLAGAVTREPEAPRREIMSVVAVVVGMAALAGGSIAATAAVSGPVSPADMVTAAAASLGIALLTVAVSETLFKPQPKVMLIGANSLRAEDADVDELLRVMAEAEDTLAAKHTVTQTVMITDMKSFSSMTEQDGSVLTAKTIQRHRDLLLPVVLKHEGRGKSTGGDGLLAAFKRPGDALTAAVDMQRVLATHNAEHPGEREISVRVGIAQGEIVVDKHGRPFIGDALNRAARTMDLADGGQVFATSDVVAASPGGPPSHDHGPHQVKNIAEPLGIMEVLWSEGQQPRAPRKDRAVPSKVDGPAEGPGQTGPVPAPPAPQVGAPAPPPPPSATEAGPSETPSDETAGEMGTEG
jgi:class 3 adenylate cyclase